MTRAIGILITVAMLTGCHAADRFILAQADVTAAREAERLATWTYGGVTLDNETVTSTLGELAQQGNLRFSSDDLTRLGHDLRQPAVIVKLVETEALPFIPRFTGKYKTGRIVVLPRNSWVLTATFAP